MSKFKDKTMSSATAKATGRKKVQFVAPGEKLPKVVPTEHSEQVRFVSRVRTFYPRLSDLVAAVPNGAKRSTRQGKYLKDEGLLAGYPDLIIDVPMVLDGEIRHGLRIEMKRQKGGVVSADQGRIIGALRRAGYAAAVCEGCEEAWEVFQSYLAGKTHPRLSAAV